MAVWMYSNNYSVLVARLAGSGMVCQAFVSGNDNYSAKDVS